MGVADSLVLVPCSHQSSTWCYSLSILKLVPSIPPFLTWSVRCSQPILTAVSKSLALIKSARFLCQLRLGALQTCPNKCPNQDEAPNRSSNSYSNDLILGYGTGTRCYIDPGSNFMYSVISCWGREGRQRWGLGCKQHENKGNKEDNPCSNFVCFGAW